MTNSDYQNHHRRSIRLKGYDYAQPGWYFVTVCTYKKTILFGDVDCGAIILNKAGNIVEQCWNDIPNHFPHVQLDQYVIMPNHIHGILVINDIVGAKNVSPLQQNKFQSPSKTVGSIVRGFKIGVTKWFRSNTNIHDVWQRNYYEQIIRDENDLNRIRRYIIENPLKWRNDAYIK